MSFFLRPVTEPAYALFRFVTGLLFLVHGSQKLLGLPGDRSAVELLSLVGLAGIIELVGGLLIAVGLFSSWAAFIASGQMAVAYFLRHASHADWMFPILNHGELATLYCFAFLFIAARGSGRYSLDRAFGMERGSR